MKLSKNLQVLIVSVILMMCLMSTSCTIGIKKKTDIVYVSLAKPSEFKGKIKVATNKKIPVTVGDNVAEMDAGGYILIQEHDLDLLLESAVK